MNQKRSALTTVIILGAILFSQLVSMYFFRNNFKAEKVVNKAAGKTSEILIDEEANKGSITKDQTLLYKAQSLLEPQNLPDKYKGSPAKDGTFLLRKIKAQLKNMKDRSIKNRINDKLPKIKITSKGTSRKGMPMSQISGFEDLTRTFNTTHFSIRYTTNSSDYDKVSTTDSDGDGIPDYVEMTGGVFENVWRYEVTNLGYREPPGTSTRYNVFIKDLGFAYGYTAGEAPSPLDPMPSFIVVENDFSGFPGTPTGDMQVTAAHEFFHAIQFAYNSFDSDWTSGSPGPSSWWMEATATWMEDIVYPGVNDYLNYLYIYWGGYDGWYAFPYMKMSAFDGLHEYGSIVFPKYLSEKRGGVSTIKSVWERTPNYDFRISRNRVEKLIGSTLANLSNTSLRISFSGAVAQFSTGNYYLNYIDKYYMIQKRKNEWPNYPYNIKIDRILRSYPTGNLRPLNPPSYLGSNYIVLSPQTTTGTTKTVSFSGGSSTSNSSITAKWSVRAIIVSSTGGLSIRTIVSPGGTSGSLAINNFGSQAGVRKIIVVAAVINTVTNGTVNDPPKNNYRFNYTFSAR